MAQDDKKVSVLFVCLGNICRSPMAEGVFRHLTRSHPRIGRIDSAGTAAYHSGEPPDSRTMSTLEDNGITDYVHEARKVQPEDFEEFDYVLAMDKDNFRNLKRMKKMALGSGSSSSAARRRAKIADDDEDDGVGARVMMFGDFGGKKKNEEIDDPYYGGRWGFDEAYEQAVRFTNGFLKALENEQ
ncbi:phosphotyrosine protein phosphatases I [Xylona heveae TC161]|uniref:Phosphotyrosine protein phosphatases I n=1 Tax=Xylona heveae (strain CBS 132557 / TC161) TaxID=1328760 RepID=A0A164ZGE1_XYLHT|nr:phosphotyrosine protein phosphatases I [Xylona heveae TC161]KZF19070.1 phosphotyrosine protein phosphatases I [Xylona heveae TC161]